MMTDISISSYGALFNLSLCREAMQRVRDKKRSYKQVAKACERELHTAPVILYFSPSVSLFQRAQVKLPLLVQ